MKWLGGLLFNFCSVCRTNQSPTVRLAFPLMFVTVAFLGAQAILSTESSYIVVEPSTNSLKAGEPFSLNIYVNAHTPINAVNLEIDFPEDQMTVTGIATGESVITLWTVDPYVDGNTVVLRGGTFRRGFVGEHLVATVNARAVSTGIAEITVSDFMLLAGDGSGTEVGVDSENIEAAKVYIADQNGNFAQGASPNDNETVELSGLVTININTDIDGDGEVSLADVSRFMSAWTSGSAVFDFNGDGKMTFRDFGIILSDSFFK